MTLAASHYHYTLLNEIHAQKAGRKVVDPHHFTKTELDKLSHSVGDGTRLGELNWERSEQQRLVAATVAAMAAAFPFTGDEEA